MNINTIKVIICKKQAQAAIAAGLAGSLFGIMLASFGTLHEPLSATVMVQGRRLVDVREQSQPVASRMTPAQRRRMLRMQRRGISYFRGPTISILDAKELTTVRSSSSTAPVTRPLPTIEEVKHPAAPAEQSSVSSSSEAAHEETQPGFPAFEKAIYPVSRIPNWGAMRNATEWNRPYSQMTEADFVAIPAYDLAVLTTPLSSLVDRVNDPEVVQMITAKLFYSTRFFGAYNLDKGEFTGNHPGVDLKLALGTPLGSLAGGRVNAVSSNSALGTYVIVEHRIAGTTFYSVYGHLGTTSVREGQDVRPGQTIGTVGMTGNTSAPHVHLQVDIGEPGEAPHSPYRVESMPSAGEAARHMMNPISFISKY